MRDIGTREPTSIATRAAAAGLEAVKNVLDAEGHEANEVVILLESEAGCASAMAGMAAQSDNMSKALLETLVTHAAVLARGMGVPLRIEQAARSMPRNPRSRRRKGR